MIEVLSVASEVFPLVKTGGLADVAGALPGALAAHGVTMRTLVPGYPEVAAAALGGREIAWFDDLFGGPARLVAARVADLDLIVIDAEHLYHREGGPYVGPDGRDHIDNWKRFAALGWVGAELGRGLVEGYFPQVLHAHDWQGALGPAYVRYGAPSAMKSVLTVHNLAFQGQFGSDIFSELRLPMHAFSVEGAEYYGGVGFLKAGLQTADKLTTVSPTYAAEIRTPEYGMGLEGVLNARADDLVGILNGIDTTAWDPERDPALAMTYRANSAHKRLENKAALIERFGLAESRGPLFAVVSRLTWQKGMDILCECVPALVAEGAQLCVLGSGETDIENWLSYLAGEHPGQVALIRGYDEALSHLIQGGADAILIPSRFEPCGLTQLIGLRYGCVPVVARVGGLADTVIDANIAALEAEVATGIQFSPVAPAALVEAIRRAVALYHQPRHWDRMRRRGMKTDVSWGASAGRYAALYRELIGQGQA